MNDAYTSLKLERPNQKPRVFRFDDDEVRIGFTPACHLALEPFEEGGAEAVIKLSDSEPARVSASYAPGEFALNGAPLTDETTLNPGDVPAANSCRIIVQSVPGPPAANVDSEFEEMPTVASAEYVESPKDASAKAAAPTPSESSPKKDTQEKRQAKSPEKKAKQAESPKTGLDFLYLFFKPVEEHLKDPAVSEVMVNGPDQIYIERKGRLISCPEKFLSEQALQAAVMNVARSVNRFFNQDNPRLDARLPDGSRVHAVMPPMSRKGTTVAIRKFSSEKLTLDRLIEFGSLTDKAAKLLDVVVTLGKNLIVSGATSSGKTSVLNVLSTLIPENDRILVLEDASELQLQQPHVVSYETRKPDEYGKGEVSIRDLLHSALRLRPDRLVVGEIRGGEALDLLQAMNTGHEGSMSTIHANSPRDSLFRLETCALFSGIDLPLSALREQVASAVQIVLQTARLHDGTRKIIAVTEVLGLENGNYVVEDILRFQEEGVDKEGRIQGRHVFTGHEPEFIKLARKRGLEMADLNFAKED